MKKIFLYISLSGIILFSCNIEKNRVNNCLKANNFQSSAKLNKNKNSSYSFLNYLNPIYNNIKKFSKVPLYKKLLKVISLYSLINTTQASEPYFLKNFTENVDNNLQASESLAE